MLWLWRTSGHVRTSNPNGAGILVHFNPLRLFAVFAVLFAAAACHASGGDRLTRCPKSSADPVLPIRVHAQYAPIELQLPEGSIQAPRRPDAQGQSEAWTRPDGLVVGYSVSAHHKPELRPISDDRQVTNCSERIGGRTATIRLLYSEETTAAGQYVSASWTLISGESLVLGVTHPDSSERDELLSIVRSVRFRKPVR